MIRMLHGWIGEEVREGGREGRGGEGRGGEGRGARRGRGETDRERD